MALGWVDTPTFAGGVVFVMVLADGLKTAFSPLPEDETVTRQTLAVKGFGLAILGAPAAGICAWFAATMFIGWRDRTKAPAPVEPVVSSQLIVSAWDSVGCKSRETLAKLSLPEATSDNDVWRRVLVHYVSRDECILLDVGDHIVVTDVDGRLFRYRRMEDSRTLYWTKYRR